MAQVVAETFNLQDELVRLKSLKDEEKALSAQYEDVKAARKSLEIQLYEYMMDNQIKSMKLQGVGNFVTQATVTGYIEADRMDDFIAWCKATNNEDVFLQIKHRGQPLNEFVRESLKEGTDLPPGVTPKETPYISIRKA